MSFLSAIIVGAMISMGVGAIGWMVFKTDGWLMSGARPMWAKWKDKIGFTQLEFVERAVNDMTGIPNKRERVIYQFGPAAGCLSLLLFIPMQLIVTPIGYAVLAHRKSVLRWRLIHLPAEQREQLASEYRDWLES